MIRTLPELNELAAFPDARRIMQAKIRLDGRLVRQALWLG